MKNSIFSRKNKIFLVLALFFAINSSVFGNTVTYKEEWYSLYRETYQQNSDEILQNMYYLEQSAKADFCNPQFALAKIENETQWEKYRYLFMMNVNLKLIEQHMRMARLFDKKKIYFYDVQYREEYLRNLEKAKVYYTACYAYWEEAKIWADKANMGKFNFMYLTDVQKWEDDKSRIVNGKLNYQKILDREISRINKNIEELKALPEME